MEKQLQPATADPLVEEEAKQPATSDLQYVSVQLEGQTYGGWYRVLEDGRMEVLSQGNMLYERRSDSAPVEQACGMLIDRIRAAMEKARVKQLAEDPSGSIPSPPDVPPDSPMGAGGPSRT